ncbi:MAG: mechanosensitive ion channel family protein [Spirosomaceae bacterium]|nr:mechanosensitive ion channel family protein [Spirosomataceae bacterium]
MTSPYLQILYWSLFIFGGYLLGLLIKKYALPFIGNATKRTEIILDDALISGVQRIAVPITTLVGFSFGFIFTSIFSEYRLGIKRVIVVCFILLITWAAIIIVDEIAHFQMNKIGKSLPKSSILLNLINVLLGLIGLLFILQYLGISILPALTALGVGGLAVALALQDTLSNLFAGLQLVASKKIKVGDYLILSANEEGILEDISWRNSTIRTLINHIIIIPNGTLASSIVKNFALPDTENSILIPVGVAYDSDLEHVERVTIEVAKKIQETIEGATRNHQPFTRYNLFADSSINFNVVLRGDNFASQFLMRHEFIKALHKRYEQEGIEIPFPIRTLYHKNSIEQKSDDNS